MSAAFTGMFGGVVAARNALYDAGWLKANRLSGRVISIGNISVGGSGKTPFVILLGELLKRRGIRFDVLSRGYRRKTKGIAIVNPQGSSADFGDEPLLIARKLQVPVIVGSDRYQAGLFAEQRFGPQLHLLDDGFQHRRLARDYDIVLVTPEDAHDRLLPGGRLREPLSSLRRANAVVLTPGTRAEDFPIAHKLVLRVERGISVPPDTPAHPVAFCAIGRPEQFFTQLREHGIVSAAERRFRDHHAYAEQDVVALKRLAQSHGANGFVTTEKDAINLGPLATHLSGLYVVSATMALEDADSVLNRILATAGI